MSLPLQSNMIPLTLNIEGLRAHSILFNMFIGSPDVTIAQSKWRTWLVHCLTKAARHYNNAHKLVLDQINERNRSAEELTKGRQLPILDFSFEMEDCITSLDKAIICIQALHKNGELPTTNVAAMANEAGLLRKFRNKQEHMHGQLSSGQTGDGPLLVTVNTAGDCIELLKLSMPLSAVHGLIDAVYHDVASLYPGHDQTSPAKSTRALKLSVSATITTIERSAEGA